MSPRGRSRVPAGVPAWPAWMVPAALAGTWAAGWVVLLLVAVTLAIRGADAFDGPSLLLLSLLTAGAGVAIMTALAAKVAPPTPAAFGLRPVPLRLAGVGVLAALGAVALAAVVAQVAGGAFDGLPVPPEVSEQGALGRLVGDPDPTVVDLGGGAVSSLLARAVVLPLFAELLLRGFCLPILARRFGDRAAVAGVAVATALLGAGAAGSGWLLLPGLVLGFALCLLYLETGSILPGTIVSAVWSGAVLGIAFRWNAADAAFLALSCGALAGAAALAIARPRGADLRAAYP